MAHSLLCFVFLCSFLFLLSNAEKPSAISFHEGFNPLYGEFNVVPYEQNKSVRISMDERSSSGFHSKQMYMHGHFQSSIKLPANYTAGVVVTFYTSNNQKYPHNHDEIDFEFLGHIDGQKWLVQTNFYGNGSTSRGREERYVLWFDPSADFHKYGILWTGDRITYYVDDVPIRHVNKVDAMARDFPSQEMKLYSTIWNGSEWATLGGKYKLDMSKGPYVAHYTNFALSGCPQDPAQDTSQCSSKLAQEVSKDITPEERKHMQAFRSKYMTYSYCYDVKRYPVRMPECVFDQGDLARLQKFDPRTFRAV